MRIDTDHVVQPICKHPGPDLQQRRWGSQPEPVWDRNGAQNCDADAHEGGQASDQAEQAGARADRTFCRINDCKDTRARSFAN